jgi:hypothetical protein
MSSRPEPASFGDLLPKMIKYCKTCRRDTPHEVRGGPGMDVVMCISCLSRALTYEPERD